MVVPVSALHRAGLCPSCGAKILITEENTRPHNNRRGGGLLSRLRDIQTTSEPREEAWREFAAAVDLYNARRYAESLTVLNALGKKFPGNIHIEAARSQCMAALEKTVDGAGSYAGRRVDTDSLNAELVKSVVLDKLMNGSTEEVQLEAAKLASRLLGMSDKKEPAAPEEEGPSIVIDPWRSRRYWRSDTEYGEDSAAD